MSKRQSKTGVPHLVYQANTGFQYYLTFPKHFAANPKLPAQIRWSLSHDEALARDLARYLNASFEFCYQLGTPVEGEVKELMKQAKQAQQSGNTEECIVHTTKALQLLELPGSSSDTAGAGSGAGS